MNLVTPDVVDGWYPRLRYPYVMVGALNARVFDVRDGSLVYDRTRVTHNNSYPAGWFSDTVFVFTEDTVDNEWRTIYWFDVTGKEVKRYGPFHSGNNVVATNGHIYYALRDGLYIDFKKVADGFWLPQSPRQGAPNYVTAVEDQGSEDYRICLMSNGSIVTRGIKPQTDYAHVSIPGVGGLISYGYFGPVRIIKGDIEWDATVTPYRKESPHLIIEGPWAIFCTEQPESGPGVMSGPLGSLDVVQFWGVNAVWVDAQYVDEDIVIASSGDRGQLTLMSHSLEAERKPIVEETTMEPPKITIASYDPNKGIVMPLKVRAVWEEEAGSGPIDTIDWRYRREGDSVWIVAASNPAEDKDHTYSFYTPGRYEISAVAYGPGGSWTTGKKRIVTVMG